jgi:hypothetical protein
MLNNLTNGTDFLNFFFTTTLTQTSVGSIECSLHAGVLENPLAYLKRKKGPLEES